MFTTPNEWIAVALALLGGWLLGLASHPGGRKWRDRYNAERDAHAAARRDAEARLSASDARLRELEADHGRAAQAEARLAEIEGARDERAGELARGRESLALAQSRIRELEREVDRLRTTPQPLPASVTADRPATTVAQPAPTSPTPEPLTPTRRVVDGSRSERGWFDWGPSGDPRAHRG